MTNRRSTFLCGIIRWAEHLTSNIAKVIFTLIFITTIAIIITTTIVITTSIVITSYLQADGMKCKLGLAFENQEGRNEIWEKIQSIQNRNLVEMVQSIQNKN